MAKLRIQRVSEPINLLRKYKVYINGDKVGSIANGEAKDFTVPEGRYTVEAKIDWCGSQKLTIDLREEEIKRLKVRGFKYANLLIIVAAIVMILNLVLSNYLGFILTLFFLVPSFLIMLYVLVIRRKKYLLLTE